MTNREKLQENYEDSVLALLMDEFAGSEGKRYIEENDSLLQNPDAAVPEDIEKRALHYIDQRFSRINRKNHGGKVLRFLGRLAIAAIIAALLFGAAFALSETVRAGTLNFLMQINERIATWQLVEDSESGFNENPDNYIDLVVGWLPEGYITTSQTISGPSDLVAECTNRTGGVITVSVHESDDSIYSLDLEESNYSSEVSFQNGDGVLVIKDDIVRICWLYKNTSMIATVESADVDVETLILVAENVSVLS